MAKHHSDDDSNKLDIDSNETWDSISESSYVENDFVSDVEKCDDEKEKFEIDQVKHSLKAKKTNKKLVKVDEYEIDSSDEEDLRNTIGNTPIETYKDYSHVGYDWDGNKIIKPSQDDQVDDFINKMDDPYYWRTVKDRSTGKKVILTDVDVDVVQRIAGGKYPDPNYNPYSDFIDFFTYKKSIHPVTNKPETKASFAVSTSERRAIIRLVTKLRRSKKLPPPKPKDTPFSFNYDLWEKDGELTKRHLKYIQAPKLLPPGHEESYNPPPEFLFDKEELIAWQREEPEQRRINFVPKKYSNLRHVPGYKWFLRERFDRCLDLYLCPRIRKMRTNINPEDLIPKLPKPKDLYPFPNTLSLVYIGHENTVRTIDVEIEGQYLISGSDDQTFRIWEVLTGRCINLIKFESSVKHVQWCSDRNKCLCLVVTNNMVYIINPLVGSKMVYTDTNKLFLQTEKKNDNLPSTSLDPSLVSWEIIYNTDEFQEYWNKGIRAIIKHKFEVKQVAWHYKGDYFAALMPSGANKSVVIHQLSKQKSQVPFTKSKGIIQCVAFHPSKPIFFVATHRYVRIYNLVKQKMIKKLLTNSNHVSSIAIHPEGNNLIIGCYDIRLSWFDLDLSHKPYKTFRYHKKAIRQVAFHPKYPLFASASDDGSTIVAHGMTYNDFNKNALIVPVKVLRGHKLINELGVLDCCFHPKQPWIFSAGADSTIRLYTH